MEKDSDSKFIDTRAMTLEEWLGLLSSPPSGALFVNFCFPSREHEDEYRDYRKTIRRGGLRPFQNIFNTIMHIRTGCSKLERLYEIRQSDPELFKRMMQDRHNKRLMEYVESGFNFLPWEGITWILDLLPHWPSYALQALNAYFQAHCQHLPDGRLAGLSNAGAVIRAKFIGLPGKQSWFRSVSYESVLGRI